MRGIAKMMAVSAATKDNGRESGRRDYGRSETDMAYPYMGGDYYVQDRFRDRRGREHYDNGRYAPRNERDGGMMANYPRYNYPRSDGNEMRYGGYGNRDNEMRYNYPDRIGFERDNQDGHRGARSEMDEVESRRRRDSRGRFRSEMDYGDRSNPGMHYPGPYPFPPPVYERREGGQDMRPIGFAANDGFRELESDYRQDAAYRPINEMEYRKDSNMIMGGASVDVPPLDEEMAQEWMKNLKNEDGTKGPHWSKEQVKQVIKQQNWDVDDLEAWVALNAMYSDYFNVAKKHNVNNLNFYVDLAKAFMGDKDAKDDKLALYYCYIVK